jgi:hypothetical protein
MLSCSRLNMPLALPPPSDSYLKVALGFVLGVCKPIAATIEPLLVSPNRPLKHLEYQDPPLTL